jgi:hypothetical protein
MSGLNGNGLEVKLFMNQLPASNDVRYEFRKWADQLISAVDIRDVEPLDELLLDTLSRLMVQHLDELWSFKDRLIDEDTVLRGGVRVAFDQGNQRHGNLGLASYGNIYLPNGETVPLSYTVRIKDPAKLESKIRYLFKEWKKGNFTMPTEIYDLIAARLVIGETDREFYHRPFSPHFNPKSPVLDKVISFMSQYSDTEYRADNHQVKLIKEYNRRLSNAANHLFARASLGYRKSNQISALDSVDSVLTQLGVVVLPEHLRDMALMLDFYDFLASNKKIKIFRNPDYVFNPKANGYSAMHMMFTLDSGFTPVHREMQLRTGFQHVYASHPKLGGHELWLAEQERPKERGLITDYGPGVGVLIGKNYSI